MFEVGITIPAAERMLATLSANTMDMDTMELDRAMATLEVQVVTTEAARVEVSSSSSRLVGRQLLERCFKCGATDHKIAQCRK